MEKLFRDRRDIARRHDLPPVRLLSLSLQCFSLSHAPVPVPKRKKKPAVLRVPVTKRLGFPSPTTLEGGPGGDRHYTAVVTG